MRVASAEDAARPESRKYTEVITPPTVTPVPEEETETEEKAETLKAETFVKKEEEILLEKKRDTPSAMSFRGVSPVSELSIPSRILVHF